MSTTEKSVANAGDEEVKKGTKRAAEVRCRKEVVWLSVCGFFRTCAGRFIKIFLEIPLEGKVSA